MYFAHWFNLYLQQPDPAARPLEVHARWIFVLLSKVEDHISADDMSLLRNLARACLALLKESIKARISSVKSEDLDSPNSEGDDQESMSERAYWIIVCAIVGVWAQRDLWMDAEDMLKTL
jgi:Survival motor neuron (SMN) interacting protein 1 (SIP1)